MIFFKIYNLFLLIKSQLSPIITIKPKQANYIKDFMQCENPVSQPTPWKVPMKSPICFSDTFRPQNPFWRRHLAIYDQECTTGAHLSRIYAMLPFYHHQKHTLASGEALQTEQVGGRLTAQSES